MPSLDLVTTITKNSSPQEPKMTEFPPSELCPVVAHRKTANLSARPSFTNMEISLVGMPNSQKVITISTLLERPVPEMMMRLVLRLWVVISAVLLCTSMEASMDGRLTTQLVNIHLDNLRLRV